MIKNHHFGTLFLFVLMIPALLSAIQANTSVLMVRPMAFGQNFQTASSNAFQVDDPGSSEMDIATKAVAEFDTMVHSLKKHGIDVHVYEEKYDPSPDSIFPNNWFSIDPHSKKLILYPMMAKNRRVEKKRELVEYLSDTFGITDILDLSHWERQELFLEGTGSIVFDYAHRIAYACVSPRTDHEIFLEVCDELGYQAILFSAYDENGIPIYHTNVMMAIGTDTCILCSESIKDIDERKQVLESLQRAKKNVVDITYDQMNHFCGNVLEVANSEGQRFFVMSTKAFHAFTAEQLECFTSQSSIIHNDLDTIESIGGGGARCMLGGVWRK